MNNDTQPLMAEPSEAYYAEAQKALNDIAKHPFVKAFQEAAKPAPKPHIHGPFTFLLNQNHNALRGCTTCGAAWVGSMAGNEENLRWHPVYEIEEDE